MNIFRHIVGKGDYSNDKISCFELWKRVFLNYQYRGLSEYFPRKNYNLYSDGSSIYSEKDNVSFFYTIDGYPRELPIDYRKVIRLEAKEKIRVSFISTFEGTRIDWDSPQIKSKLRTWQTIDESMEDVNAFNKREKMESSDNNEWRKESLIYLADADVRRRRNIFKYRSLMVVSGKRGTDFDSALARIESYCSKTGIKITRITDNIESYLRYFSPFSLELNSEVLKSVGNTTIPDEIIARFSSYEQGKIGKGKFYWGVDVYSGYPVFKSFKKQSVDAENILITGETGSGKSFFLKSLILLLLAHPEFTGTINDIEGFEYIPMGAYVSNKDKVVVLNMAEGHGKYFDPVEINLTGDDELDKDMFSFSKSFTLSIIKTLLGKRFIETDEWASVIVNDAVSRTYGKRGVTLDKSTWLNSKGLTLFDVYESMKELYSEIQEDKVGEGLIDKYKMNTSYRDALDLAIAKLSVYFESLENGGTRSDVFQDKVNLEDIKDAKLVICSFGMAGKSADMVDPVQMSLTQLSAANISHLRSLFSQARGVYNFKVWEEFQRWGMFPDSEKTITTALTGGRKLGDINFIVTNMVQSLLDSDRFGIFGNITSFAIGAIDDAKTRSELCDRLSIPLLKPDLDKLVTRRGTNESFSSDVEATSKYDKAFLIRLDKVVTTIVRMELPEHLAKSTIMRTGDMSQTKII